LEDKIIPPGYESPKESEDDTTSDEDSESEDDTTSDEDSDTDGMNDEEEKERLSLLDSEHENESDMVLVPLDDVKSNGDEDVEDDEVPTIEDYNSDDDSNQCGLTDMSDDGNEADEDENEDASDPLFRDDLQWESERKPDVAIQRVKPEDRIQPQSNGVPRGHMENRSISDLSCGLMAHTPCGDELGAKGRRRECWSYGRCKKHFPKAENDETDGTIEGYPHYRRRVTITPESKYEMPSKTKMYKDKDEDKTYKYKITNKYHSLIKFFIFLFLI